MVNETDQKDIKTGPSYEEIEDALQETQRLLREVQEYIALFVGKGEIETKVSVKDLCLVVVDLETIDNWAEGRDIFMTHLDEVHFLRFLHAQSWPSIMNNLSEMLDDPISDYYKDWKKQL